MTSPKGEGLLVLTDNWYCFCTCKMISLLWLIEPGQGSSSPKQGGANQVFRTNKPCLLSRLKNCFKEERIQCRNITRILSLLLFTVVFYSWIFFMNLNGFQRKKYPCTKYEQE